MGGLQDSFSVLDGAADLVAARLLGSEIIKSENQTGYRFKIVETEAYDASDVASHSYKGQTPRSKVMFGPKGHLYVYFTYGMHYCCNIVVGKTGYGAAVLLRALEPIDEVPDALINRRHGRSGIELTNGPAKLCQALDITTAYNGHNLSEPPLKLVIKPALAAIQIVTATRIGISLGSDLPWRFYIQDNPYVSRQA